MSTQAKQGSTKEHAKVQQMVEAVLAAAAAAAAARV
jgi:hypothetical protein